MGGGLSRVGGTAAWGCAGHQSAGGEQLHCASLVLYILAVVLLLLLFFLFCPNKLSLSQPTSFSFFSDSLPHATGEGG